MGNAQAKQRSKNKYSKWDNAVPPAPPSKPTIAPGSPKNKPDLVTLRWEKPINDGGAPVTGYLVEHRRTGSPHWVRATPDLIIGTEVTLSGLEPGWRYQFRVSAGNSAGLSEPSELSEPLTVTLSRQGALAPHFVLELKDTTALENDKVEFVAVVRGHPTPTISWFKDGSEVFSDRRMRVVTEKDQSMLVIFQASFNDEGEIKCSATNRLGHSVSRARLKIEAGPTIRLQRQYEDGLVFEKDEMLRLKVSVAGRPLPRVTWYHKGQKLLFGGRHEVRNTDKSSSLRVSDARRTDSGEYQVRATNRLGENVATFSITVTDRPQPPGKPQIAMILGRSLTLSWSEPQDDGGFHIETYIVEYYRLGWNVWLKAATCRQLTTTLSDLIEGSEYKFRVKAENPCGVSDPSQESDVIFIPDPRRGLLEAPTRSRSITMGDVENRLRDGKFTKQTEHNRMTKEINLRTTSAGTLQTDRSSTIPKNITNKVLSNEVISIAQVKKSSTLPTSTIATKRDISEQNSIKGKELPQKKVVDNKNQLSSGTKKDDAIRKIGDEVKHTNTPLVLKEDPKVSLFAKTNIMRDAKERMSSTNTTHTEVESKKESEIGKAQDKREPNHTPQLLSPATRRETKEKEDVSIDRKKDTLPHPVLTHQREQLECKDTKEKQFTSPLTPREDDDSIMHGSSELMLVLLPHENQTKRTEGTDRREPRRRSMPNDGSPPRISLSAPALDLQGSFVLPPLRNAVSSSQLLHEKAMARFYEAVQAEERRLPHSPVTIRVNSIDVGSSEELTQARRLSEQDSAPSRRIYQDYESDIDRVRSKLAAVGELKRQHALRQSLSQDSEQGDAELEEEVYEDEEDEEVEEDIEEEEQVYQDEEDEELDEDEEEEEEEEESEEEEDDEDEELEEDEIPDVRKTQYKSSYDSRKTLQQKLSSLSQDDDDYVYTEEGTYHPRSMVPIQTVTSSAAESLGQGKLPSSESNKYGAGYLDERLSNNSLSANFIEPSYITQEMEHQREQLERTHDVADVRGMAEETPEQTGVVVMRPKRAEAPETPGQEVENIDADVALSAAEIARQRRLKVRQKSLEEDSEANLAIVNHYGDIIREYGTMRKSRTVMYLNTEDLKKAAYSSEETEMVQQPIEMSASPEPQKIPIEAELSNQVTKPSSKEVNRRHVEPKKQFGPQPKRKKPGALAPPAHYPPLEVKTKEIQVREPQRHEALSVKPEAARTTSETTEVARNHHLSAEEMRKEVAGRNVKFFVTFLTDLALFAVACYLYFFKDERLAIPVLIFMVYRQAMDSIKQYLIKRWTRR